METTRTFNSAAPARAIHALELSRSLWVVAVQGRARAPPHFHELAAASARGLLAIVERDTQPRGTPVTPSLPQSVAMNSATTASGWPVGL
jgi:hypothetical protein